MLPKHIPDFPHNHSAMHFELIIWYDIVSCDANLISKGGVETLAITLKWYLQIRLILECEIPMGKLERLLKWYLEHWPEIDQSRPNGL